MASYRGSPLGIRILIGLYRLLGYRAIKLFVFFIALFYAVVSSSKRFELYGYYGRVGLKPLTYRAAPIGCLVLIVAIIQLP